MDHIKWIDNQRARRERLGISQEDFAVLAGMSRTHLSRLESHASPVTKKAMRKIEHAFALAAPDALFLLIDYVRIRFKTTDARHIIEDESMYWNSTVNSVCSVGNTLIVLFGRTRPGLDTVFPPLYR